MSYEITALIDTGAMPCLITHNAVPKGSPLQQSNIKISGVANTTIDVMGKIEIPIQLGNQIFSQTFVVVHDRAMAFPQDSKAIIGANFLASNNIIIIS